MIKTRTEVNNFVLEKCKEMLDKDIQFLDITIPQTKSTMLLSLLSEKTEVLDIEKEKKCIFINGVDFPNQKEKKAALFFYK